MNWFWYWESFAAFIQGHLLVFLPVFIYSMPGYTCSIKERMLYSSCKNRLLDEVERDYQLEVTKKVHMQDQLILLCSGWFSSAVC